MRLFLFLIVLISIHSSGFAQFETYNTKGKIGLKFKGQQIVKAKYDSISLKDDSVVTAFKKSKIYFINSNGIVIYKTKIELGQEFESGIGIVQNKKGAYHLIDRTGELMQGTRIGVSHQPKRVLDIVEYGRAGNGIFNHTGILPIVYDSVSNYNDWLVVHKVYKEKYTYKVKDDSKFFGRRKVTAYHLHPYFDLYNKDASVVHAEKVVKVDSIGEYFLIKVRDSTSTILDSDGNNIFGSFSECHVISPDYIQGRQDSNSILMNLNSEKIEIKGDYLRYEFNSNIVRAVSKENDTVKIIDLYKNGELLNEQVTLIRELNADKLVIQDSIGFYISTNLGHKILGPYTFVGKIKDNHILVCDTLKYTYVNCQDWAELDFCYPLIESVVYKREGPPKDFIGSFFYLVFGGWLTDGANVKEIINNGHNFYEGWAICAVNAASSQSKCSERLYLSEHEKLRYNYINYKNEKLNAKKYKDCFPMFMGKAWVKEKNRYTVIDSTGQKWGDLMYEDVMIEASGYFVVENKKLRGVVNADYVEVVPCKYTELHYRAGAFYAGFGEEERLIYGP